MAAKDPVRRSVASTIAAVERHHGPDDPRLPALRRQLDAIGAAEITAWARRAAAWLPMLSSEEIEEAAAVARKLDARLGARKSGAA